MIMGGFVGDAIGVPYEFTQRKVMANKPCTGVTGHGTYNQPPGTWSDDSSMAYCIMDSILEGYDKHQLMMKFISWWRKAKYTATDVTFDIGLTTRASLNNFVQGIPIDQCAKRDARDNGNGSLMRTAPVIHLFEGRSVQEQYEITKEISGLTHGHVYSALSCFFFCTMLYEFLRSEDLTIAYNVARTTMLDMAQQEGLSDEEIQNTFGNIIVGVDQMREADLDTQGYVVTSLEAAVWCVLKSSSYSETILRAVNLGHDTDTIAAIAGNLAGLVYGYQSIPDEWLDPLQKRTEVQKVAEEFANKY